MNWQQQSLCTDIGDYELIVEKQKRDWKCEQATESWKWLVVYHGSIVASGSVNDMELAMKQAEANVPQSAQASDDDCGCDDQ